MENTIRMLGIKNPKDADLIAKRINICLSNNGCTAGSFFFTAEKIINCRKMGNEEVRLKTTLKNAVRISVCLNGNQCVIGNLSPTQGENLMTPEQIARNISPKPIKNVAETSTAKSAADSKQDKYEETGECIPYSTKEISDETFIGLFLIFLTEFLENDHTKVKTAADISTGFNLSSTCDAIRCLTTRRTAKLLIDLSERGKVRRVQEKPFGLYSLVPQDNPQSITPVQTSVQQSLKVTDNTADLLTTLLARKNELKATLADQEEAIALTKEGLRQVDSEIRSIPNIRELYNTLCETLG